MSQHYIQKEDRMKKYSRLLGVFIAFLCVALLFISCAEELTLQDGQYFKISEKSRNGGYLEVTLVIKDGEIQGCDMLMYTKDGNLKDETYGTGSTPEVYQAAQAALTAAKEYPNLLVELGSIDEVDAISGATETYDVFKEVVEEIIKDASKKE